MKIIKSSLQSRKFMIKIKNSFSCLNSVHIGVPQGIVLSTLLFKSFTNDMPNPHCTLLAKFADDTALLCKSCRPHTAF
ncbi:putative RNA-directed DNA polymerase from transposon BS, partial [Stegodyphus mimosarum]